MAKWLNVRLRTKWFWVWVQLQSLKLQISHLLRARSSLTFRQLWNVDSLWKAYVTWQEHTVSWYLEQIEHTNYQYSAWNWWSWPKIIDSGKFCPNTESCCDFFEIWHFQQIEHANNEYNTRQRLGRLHDHWLRMIIVSEWL